MRLLFSRGVRDTAVIILPAAAGLIALALPLSRLIFQHVHADAADAQLIAHTLQAFAVGLPFFSTFQLLTRTFYSMQDTRTPGLVNVAAAIVNVGADLLFALGFGWGIPGLALGYAVSYAFGTAILLVILRPRLGGVDGRRVGRTIAKALGTAAVAGLLAFASTRLFGDPESGTTWTGLAAVLVGVSVGVLAFVISALIVRIEEVDDIRGAMLRRFRP